MILDQAIPAHAEWKFKFLAAIMKREGIDVTIVSNDECCMLGKWLHGDGAAKFADNAFFNICRHEHAEFHQEAGQVAIAISEGRFDDADAMLNYGSSYSIASSRVNAAIIGLKRDIALAA